MFRAVRLKKEPRRASLHFLTALSRCGDVSLYRNFAETISRRLSYLAQHSAFDYLSMSVFIERKETSCAQPLD